MTRTKAEALALNALTISLSKAQSCYPYLIKEIVMSMSLLDQKNTVGSTEPFRALNRSLLSLRSRVEALRDCL